MINIKEYKGVSIADILTLTGLPNPYSDQTRFSLARQKELLLRDAMKNNLLNLIPKSHPIKHSTVNSMTDKGLTILTLREEEEVQFTSELDLNSIPHTVIREKGYRTILINRNDIPLNIVPHPSKPYSYKVIGDLVTMNCFNAGTLYKNNKVSEGRVGIKYRFNYGTHVALHILD
jgi:hypothetical protein